MRFGMLASCHTDPNAGPVRGPASIARLARCPIHAPTRVLVPIREIT